MKNYKQQFQSWLIKKYGDTGTPSSYIKAVDILDEKLDMKIFTLVDTKYLKSLYKDLIKNQGNPNDKYFDINRPSYGSRGFYSASIKSYIEFLDEYDIGKIYYHILFLQYKMQGDTPPYNTFINQ